MPVTACHAMERRNISVANIMANIAHGTLEHECGQSSG